MKSKIFLTIFMVMILSNTFGQKFSKNSVYYDAYGHTRAPLSLNYEMYVCQIYKDFHLNGRIGIGHYKYSNSEDAVVGSAIIFPVVALLEYGKKNHFVNLGAGYSASFIKKKIDGDVPRFDGAYSLSVGYKYMDDAGLFLQLYPVIIFPQFSSNEISAGISLGFSW
ncbi:hypothetical protein [Flavobacterium wongokense]|uniref:hypothetical protein n=1 Tax=Flavobacterium wongokense TaxID=2910674 RepID=UPI001F2783D0|nr:hypothetical protein [Flavobacterium sp. WG47]MCF6133539.1 hypothetical protein [Flavobacterium sp. WG47]